MLTKSLLMSMMVSLVALCVAGKTKAGAIYSFSGDATFISQSDAAMFGITSGTDGQFTAVFDFDDTLTVAGGGAVDSNSGNNFESARYLYNSVTWTLGTQSWSITNPRFLDGFPGGSDFIDVFNGLNGRGDTMLVRTGSILAFTQNGTQISFAQLLGSVGGGILVNSTDAVEFSLFNSLMINTSGSFIRARAPGSISDRIITLDNYRLDVTRMNIPVVSEPRALSVMIFAGLIGIAAARFRARAAA